MPTLFILSHSSYFILSRARFKSVAACARAGDKQGALAAHISLSMLC